MVRLHGTWKACVARWCQITLQCCVDVPDGFKQRASVVSLLHCTLCSVVPWILLLDLPLLITIHRRSATHTSKLQLMQMSGWSMKYAAWLSSTMCVADPRRRFGKQPRVSVKLHNWIWNLQRTCHHAMTSCWSNYWSDDALWTTGNHMSQQWQLCQVTVWLPCCNCKTTLSFCSVKTTALSHPFPRAIMAKCTAQISCMQLAFVHVMAFIQQVAGMSESSLSMQDDQHCNHFLGCCAW